MNYSHRAMKATELIKCDLYRYAAAKTFKKFLKYFLKNDAFNFCFWFRMSSHENKLLRRISKRIFKLKCRKFHIFLSPGTRIGAGMYIGHIDVGCIIINPGTQIGANFNISPNVCIGSNTGNCAVIGDNVYLAPNVSIVEGVNIGNDVVIGAGSVLTKDIPSYAVAAGNPAKVIKSHDKNGFIQNEVETGE
ncbi:serine acetyltransferase [Pantoea ananatis]|nr:hypothetical protein [Pantoea ananatis]